MDAPAAEAPAQGITEQNKTAPEREAAVNQGETVQAVEFYLHEVMDTDGNVIKIDAGERANQTSLAANGDAGTHSPASMELTPAEGSLAGPAPAASSETSSPVEGTRPLSFDSTIPQGAGAVNFGEGARPGTRDRMTGTTDGQEEPMDPKFKQMLESFYGKIEEPKPRTPEESQRFRMRLEELAARPMTKERVQELTRDGQEDP